MSDDLDSDLDAPAGGTGGANPFSPTGGEASSSNEGRLMQVLEMMAGVMRDQ